VDTWGPLRHWLEPLWQFSGYEGERATGFWRPLTLQVLAWARAISDGAAWGPHLVSLVLHWLASLAVVGLARRLGLRSGLAWAAGFLFALHPIQVQAVAWASSINDPLLGLCTFGALIGFHDWVQRGQRAGLVWAMLGMGLGLLCKEQAAGILPLAGLLAWWRWRLPFAQAVKRTLPLFLVLLVYYGLRVSIFDSWDAGLRGAVVDFALRTGRAVQFRFELLGGFAGMLLWPADLPFFRGVRPELPPGTVDVTISMVLAGVWLGAIGFSVLRGKRSLGWLLALPVVWLAPQVVFYESAGAFPQSDRYLYVPLFAFAVLAVQLLGRLQRTTWIAAATVLLAGVYTARSQAELASYSDNETFFRNAIHESPNVPVSYWSLGRELLGEYKRDGKIEKLQEAIVQYLTCLTLGRDYGDRAPKLHEGDPLYERMQELEDLIHNSGLRPPLGPYVTVSTEDLFQANMGQGWCFIAAGELPQNHDTSSAIEVFEQLTTTFPGRYEAWIGLGMAYYSAQDFEKARVATGKALECNPASPEAWYNLGEILRQKGDFAGAANAFREAGRFRPYDIKDRLAQVESWIDAGQPQVAEHELNALEEAHRTDPRVQYLQGMLAANRGQWESALNAFDRLLAQEPENKDAHLQRGKVLVQIGRTNEAVAALGRVCELDSTNFEAHRLLGEILLANPNTQNQAREYLERAYGLGRPGPARLRVQSELAQWIEQDENALFDRMQMDEARGDFEAARRWIELIRRLPDAWKGDPERKARLATMYLTEGNCLRELGESERAIAAYRAGNAEWDGSFWCHYNLGSLLYDLNRFEEALPEFERALEQIEQVPTKENLRGAVRQTLQSQIERSRKLGPEFIGPPVESPGLPTKD
ncbi:MAG TPA: tetratricopeptide repeat protein, partial [Planctomycetota bacterium]|nr:tetratricopeptide repeat protein [Planctomycetota bacterium]